MSSTRWVGRSPGSASTRVGWYSTARWLANHRSERRSSHSAYATSLCEDSAHNVTRWSHDGAYLGRFFCMKGRWPRSTRMTDNGRPRSAGTIRSRAASR
jgi:hypothetical protein